MKVANTRAASKIYKYFFIIRYFLILKVQDYIFFGISK